MEKRIFILKITVSLMMIAIILRLFSLQLTHGREYKQMSVDRISTTSVDKAPRGDILDRYGRPLITNRIGYSLKIKKTGMKSQEFNKMANELLNILDKCGYQYKDTLPLSFSPYQYVFEDTNSDGSTEDERKKWLSERKKITADMSPQEVVAYYRKNVYNVSDEYSEYEARRIIGFRYDADISGFSAVTSYTVMDDVDVNVITQIKERQDEFPGVYISREYFRNYEYETLGAHILGGIGKLNREEYDVLKSKGYGYNDMVGKTGIEKITEEYLRGNDGRKDVMRNIGEEIVLEDIPSEPGNYVTLTLDSELQKAAEKSLEKRIKDFAARGTGANAGAAVVLDVKNGDVLVCANYPTYNPENFNKDYKELVEDEAKPIWNRALSGTYTPGSTLKPLVAIAALESGAIGKNEYLECNGIYTYYKDYRPKCWILSSKGETHGWLDVSGAIANSCNCFFYETGRRCGIDVMNEYAKMYGLGEPTGIEFKEEASGAMSNPEYKAKLAGENGDAKWYSGDVIQTAIGQSYSAFTPIQLANYTAAIANGGTLYKTHIIKSVRSTVTGELIKGNKTEILNKIDVKSETLEAVRKGMFGVADEGSASSVFEGYPIEIGGKTGTAQVGKNKSDNALFIAFAPYESPEIAVAIVIEKGETGANAAYVARDIFDEYFGINKKDAKIKTFGELLP